MLTTGQVIWVFDRTTNPQKHRMMVCVSFEDGWFLRVNTNNRFRPAVPIDRARNPWLDHDSHVECVVQEWDEFEITEAIRERGGSIGLLHRDHYPSVLAELLNNRFTRKSDKEKLRVLLA